MQTEKLQKKIESSFESFLIAKLKNENFSLLFQLPKITIKGNSKLIDEEQTKLKKLSLKYSGFNLNTTKTIKGTIIESISFTKDEDYLNFLGKKEYFLKFLKSIDIIKSSNISNMLFSSGNFEKWIEKNIFKINENDKNWSDILKVVEYFLLNRNSNLYLRELPIKVHSKFIENNQKILTSILDFLHEELQIECVSDSFLKKFGINKKPDFVRFRFLDKSLVKNYYGSFIDDIFLKILDFDKLNIDNLENIYIIENEINYLTFPLKVSSIAIFGAGFNVLNLRDISFFKEKNIYYFGDLDSHGFKILAYFRKYFPQTKSIFMDKKTFYFFFDYKCEGNIISESELENLRNFLNQDEFDLVKFLNLNNLRLEQENITQDYIINSIKNV